MMTLATVYQSSEYVKMARRPKRSATKLTSAVPTKSPENMAATKPAMPVEPKRPGVVGVRMPERTRPGAM